MTDNFTSQDDIDALMQQVAQNAEEDPSSDASDALSAAQNAVDALQGEFNAQTNSGDGGGEGSNMDLPSFQKVVEDVAASGISMLNDVDLDVKIELGRTEMLVEDVLRLNEGSVVELDKLAGDPVDVYVNERLVARGEVLVLNDNFCVRINEIVAELTEEELQDNENSAPPEAQQTAQPAQATEQK